MFLKYCKSGFIVVAGVALGMFFYASPVWGVTGGDGQGGGNSDPGTCGNGGGDHDRPQYLIPTQGKWDVGSDPPICPDCTNPLPPPPEIFIPVPCEGPGCYEPYPGSGGGGGGGGGGGSGNVCVLNAGQLCQSLPNACGLTSAGRFNCAGICTAISPSNSECPLPGAGFGPGSGSGANSGNTQLVNRGEPCTIEWTTSNASSCKLLGPGVSASGTTGKIQTPPLSATTVYTLTCSNGVQSVSRNFTCRINPNFSEF